MAVTVAPTRAALTPRAGGQMREFRLTASAMTYEFVKGQPTTAWKLATTRCLGPNCACAKATLYASSSPTTCLRPTTIHWHLASNVPTSMDGVPGISQPPVPLGRHVHLRVHRHARWHALVSARTSPNTSNCSSASTRRLSSSHEMKARATTAITTAMTFGEWSPDAPAPRPQPTERQVRGGMGGMGNMMSDDIDEHA